MFCSGGFRDELIFDKFPSRTQMLNYPITACSLLLESNRRPCDAQAHQSHFLCVMRKGLSHSTYKCLKTTYAFHVFPLAVGEEGVTCKKLEISIYTYQVMDSDTNEKVFFLTFRPAWLLIDMLIGLTSAALHLLRLFC